MMNRTQTWLVVRRIAILTVAVAAMFHTGRAEAQWGYGGFWGLNPLDSSQVVQGINERAAIAGQAAYAARQNIQPLNGGADSYRNPSRDADFVDRVGISTRRGLESRVANAPAPTPVPVAVPTPAPTPPRQPVISLSGFFNRDRVLVWPADAPMSGGLDIQRIASDKACLTVFDEQSTKGVASISSVTEARNLLLDYGRPALRLLRQSATPQIADTFHLFLLSLYESLAQAAMIPPPPKR
jgi:hypothetical protein